MSTDDILWYANLGNVVALSVSLASAFWLWRLSLRQEAGSDNLRLRRLAGRVQFSFAILAAIATFALWRYSIVASKEADAKIAGAQSVADGARAQAGEAQKEAGAANERAAKANERAADLEKEAAEARVRQAELERGNLELRRTMEAQRVEQARIRAAVAKRQITVEQLANIRRELLKYTDKVIRLGIISDSEAQEYGQQLRAAFEGGGVLVRTEPFGIVVPPVYGITINAYDDSWIAAAFKAANIEFTSGAPGTGLPLIVVGLKPPKM